MCATMTAQPGRSKHSNRAFVGVRFAGTFLLIALTAAACFAASQEPGAQAPAINTASAAHRKPHQRNGASKTPPQVAQTPPVPLVPPAPKPPDWPANDQPKPASVVWNSQGLRIDASNSSLQQILKEVATETGAKVEGMGADQRIFGIYGPGPARDVLSQLLDGSGYNVLMVGDQGQGTPREIVLSQPPQGPAPPVPQNQNSEAEDNADVADQPQPQPPPQPPNVRNGFNPGAPPRTPQQIIQELQQRQQQMQQMQQQQLQQQQNNPQ